MYPPCSWSTQCSVSLHQGLQFHLLILSWLKINEVCILIWYPNEWLSVGTFRIRPPLYRPSRYNLYHLVCHILLSFFVFSPDSMHHTLYSGIQCLCTMLLHHSVILWIFRHTWQQPQHLITPIIEWMESQCSCDLKFESKSHFHCNWLANTVFSLVQMGFIKNPKTACSVRE